MSHSTEAYCFTKTVHKLSHYEFRKALNYDGLITPIKRWRGSHNCACKLVAILVDLVNGALLPWCFQCWHQSYGINVPCGWGFRQNTTFECIETLQFCFRKSQQTSSQLLGRYPSWPTGHRNSLKVLLKD